MRAHPLRLLVLLSLVAGVLAGAIAAVAVPRDAKSVTGPRLEVRRTAAALPAVAGQTSIDVLPGTTHVVLTAPDPAGGPDWALRRFSGPYAFPTDMPRRTIGKELLGRKDCLELGRVVDGRFGWLDGAGTFRPIAGGVAGSPRSCVAHGRRRADESAALASWVSHPDFGEPQPLASVVWGSAPAGTHALTVALDDDDRAVHRGGDGAFLSFLPAAGQSPDLHVVATDGAGKTSQLYVLLRPHAPGIERVGRGRLVARGPDPAGGASWGVAAGRTKDGRWCTGNAGRVVDGTVGQLDARLDLFYDQSDFVYSCPPDSPKVKAKFRVLTRQRPLMYSYTSGGYLGDQRPGGSAGRIALRSERGSTVFSGIARGDVRTITVVTPSQTRVVRPSGAAHAFVIPLEGTFPSGQITFTVAFADGTTVTQGERADPF
jgi:hypothetical protein